jgi:DNA/RNA endonuclease G (NUC1)
MRNAGDKTDTRLDAAVSVVRRLAIVDCNHLDHSSEAIKQTNTVTNILPQVASVIGDK